MKKAIGIFRILLLFVITTPVIGQHTIPAPASFVWSDETGEGRNQYLYFRYDLNISNDIKEARIHLYASSRYHLKINGSFVNFGPLRSFPASPVYDSYDISSYLREGQNVIAVKVMNNGMNTFQLPDVSGGFIAWGSISTASEKYSLETSGNWVCIPSDAYDAQSPKFSFACGPIEIYDERRDIRDWDLPETEISSWKKCTTLKNDSVWGELKPRPTPHLTKSEQKPLSLLGIYNFEKSENIYSFQVKTPDESRKTYNRSYPLFAYTYIYSPVDQEVEAGGFWGEYFLNGVGPLSYKESLKNNYVRREIGLSLKKGWNYLFVSYGAIWGSWDFYLSLPSSSGLVVSATKNKKSESSFMVTGLFNQAEEKQIKSLKLPLKPKELPDNLSSYWSLITLSTPGKNPARETAWREFDKKLPFEKQKVENILIDDTDGRALVFDMGRKMLGRIFLEVEAPAGTVFDLVMSEDLVEGKVSVFKRIMITSATRFISAGGISRFEQFKPYGMRYVQLNVYNPSGPVTIKNMGVTEQVYPFVKTGSFKCSDPLMNRIWEMGWRTLRVCSEDTYTDTPFRERGLYAGDMLPEFAITLATSGDPNLLKYSIMVLQDMYSDILKPESKHSEWSMGKNNEFPFITLNAYYWYVSNFDDKEFAELLFPNFLNLIDWAFSRIDTETGLIFSDNVFLEWTQIEKKNVVNTAFNSIVAGSCDKMAEIAHDLGEFDVEKSLLKKGNDLKDHIRELCWDEKKGAYIDGFKDGKVLDSFYPISSAFASINNITTAEQEERLTPFYKEVLEDIGSKSRNKMSTPYGGYYLLAALYKNGNTEIAEDYIRKYWAPMIYENDDTSWENFDSGAEGETGGQGTLSHAWSGHPTYYLSTQVLGVNLGFPVNISERKHIVFKPNTNSISWAKGKVPWFSDVIEVDWIIEDKNLLFNCNVPDGHTFEVKPQGSLRDYRLFVNGLAQ